MQRNEKITTDARSFPELWKSLSTEEQIALRGALVNRLGCTSQTVWNYAVGNTIPSSLLIKNEVARVVSRITGINVRPAILFPSK